MKRNLPVRYGNGGGRAIDEQARHYTVDCLQKIADLLHAQKTKDGDDTRTQFAAAKFLLELGWGRSPLRGIAAAADETMTPEEQQKLRRFIDEYHRATIDQPAPFLDRALLGSAGSSGMEDSGAARATDAEG